LAKLKFSSALLQTHCLKKKQLFRETRLHQAASF
jgi:hypothetical protein